MSNCNSCKIILTEENRHLKTNKCRPCQRIRQDKLNILASQRRLEESGLSDKDIQLTNSKWNKWYSNYIKTQTDNNNWSTLTSVLRRRQVMKDYILDHGVDFCYPNEKTKTYELPSMTGVGYDERRKNTRPWVARNGRKHIDYYTTFDEACRALKQAQTKKT